MTPDKMLPATRHSQVTAPSRSTASNVELLRAATSQIRKTRVIPCLLLKNAGFVKTVKFRRPTYLGDPLNTVRIFNDKEADELIVLDISATPEGRAPNFALLSDIASECFMPLTYGGGVRSVEDARLLFQIGVEKICFNTAALHNPDLIREAAKTFGKQSVVISIDAKRSPLGTYCVYTHGGRRNTRKDPVEVASHVQSLGAGELLINSINRDGTMSGYDCELLRRVADAVDIPVLACGGAGSVKHLAEAVLSGLASGVAAGSLFVFQGRQRAVLINMPSQYELQNSGVP